MSKAKKSSKKMAKVSSTDEPLEMESVSDNEKAEEVVDEPGRKSASPKDENIETDSSASERIPKKNSGDVQLDMEEKQTEYRKTRVVLTFEDVRYFPTTKKSTGLFKSEKVKLDILKGVSGYAKPGEILAIMGPSGSGKSTLLDVLAGRKPSKDTSGSIRLNGLKAGEMKHISQYVMQEDALVGSLTVRENLTFSAKFRKGKQTNSEITEKVETIIREFGLSSVSDSRVGTVLLRGISGGQKRRVSIANELLNFPRIAFLDEPTSGLDSAASYFIMKYVKKLAKENCMTILCTIHQPSTEVFEQMDNLLLLSKGRTVYFGANDASLYQFFSDVGKPVPERWNPTDYMLHVVNTDFSEDIEHAEQSIISICEKYSESSHNQSALQFIREHQAEGKFKSEVKFESNLFQQTWFLFHRNGLNALRNPLVFWVRIAMYVILALLMGTVWYDVGNSVEDVQDRLAALFFSVAFLCFMSVAGIPGFLEEREVFVREVANGAYHITSYALSNILISAPYVFLIALSFSAVSYYMIMLNPGFENFLVFLISLYLALYVAESMVVMISILIPIFVIALTLGAFANGFFMIVQGFFLRRESIPDPWIWAHWIDYQKYSYEIMMKNDVDGQTFDCIPLENGSCNCGVFEPSAENPCQITGQSILESFSYTGTYEIVIWQWCIILIAMAAFFRLLILLSLKFKTRAY